MWFVGKRKKTEGKDNKKHDFPIILEKKKEYDGTIRTYQSHSF